MNEMWVWIINGTVLTGENGSVRRKTYPTAIYSTSNLLKTDLQSNPELVQNSGMLK